MKDKWLIDEGRHRSPFKWFRVTKLTLIFILTSFAYVHASDYSQQTKLNVSIQNGPVIDVLKSVENQSDFLFLYKNEDIDINRIVNIDIKNKSVEELLNQLFKDTNVSYEVVNRQIVLVDKEKVGSSSQSKQQRSISGIVTDSGGGILPGVTVLIKGTTKGTITNSTGNYTLSGVAGNATLVFSFVGMKSKSVYVNNQILINVSLEDDAIGIDEVIAVGYISQSKHKLTSAVATVSSEALSKRVATDPASLLQGQLPGLSVVQNSGEPGNENLQLRIRGLGTFSGAGSNPLVIVDGLPGSLSVINPNDIESVTVLKDAASAAIYGSRGANGVIVVKTKKGNNNEFSLTYNFNVGISTATRLPDLITNSAQYMELLNEAEANCGGAPVYTQAQIDLYRNATDRVKYPNHNWLDDVFRTVAVQNHYFNLSGGKDNTTFSLGLGYTDQPGTMLGFEYKKYTLDLGLSSRINKRTTFGTNFQIRYGNRIYPCVNSTDLYISALAQSPLYPAKTADGLWITKAYTKELGNKNPVYTAENIRTKNPDYYGQGNLSLDVDIVKGLKWENRVGISFDFNKTKDYRPAGIAQYLYSDLSFDRYADVGSTGLYQSQYDQTHATFYSQLNFQKSIEKHSISVLAGAQEESDSYSQINAFRTNYPTNYLSELNAGSTTGQTNGGTSSVWDIRSFYGTLNYDYNDKYLVGASLRFDGTSRLPKDSRWGSFYSFSGAWRIKNETFLKDVSWLDDLKIRGSWGELGNQNIGTYPYQPILSQNQYAFAGTTKTGFVPNTLVDQNLTWETTRSADLGLDLSAFKNKITFSADYFDKYTFDILRSSQVPLWLGLNAPIVNNGAVRNKGIELDLKYQDQAGEFKYYAEVSVQSYRNKLESFGKDEITGPDGQTIMRDGEPINSFYLYVMDGIFQNQDEIDNAPDQSSLGGIPTPGDIKYADVDGNGVVDSKDRKVIPGQYPKFEYSYNMGGSWRNFDASMQLYGSYGNKLYLSKWGVEPFAQGSPPTKEWLNRWTQQNPSNTMPKIYMGFYGYPKITNIQSTFHVFEASFMRIKNIQLGYTLPSNFIKGVKTLRVFFSADNVAVFTPLKQGTDPERLDISNKPDAWYGFANYPQNRTYNFGVSVKF